MRGRSRNTVFTGFHTEEGGSLWRLGRDLTIVLIVAGVILCIALILILGKWLGTFYIWLGLVLGGVLNWAVLKQARMVEHDITNKKDLAGAQAKLRKGKKIGMGLFLSLLALMLGLAAAIVALT